MEQKQPPQLDFARLETIPTDTAKKGNLTYTSWANAWAALKREDPSATWDAIQTMDGKFLHGEGLVMTQVTAFGIRQKMVLPVMDNRNAAVTNPKTTDINKAIMRCLTKNIALFGVGLHLYRGEDYPDGAAERQAESQKPVRKVGLSADARLKLKNARAGLDEKDQTVLDAIRDIYKRHNLLGENPNEDNVEAAVLDLHALVRTFSQVKTDPENQPNQL